MPANSPELVQEILTALGFDGEEAVTSHDGVEKPIRLALTHDFQIRAPHKEFLAAISQRDAANTFLRDLLDPNIRTELDQYLYGREIIDFLLDSPKLGFNPGEFVKLLRKLQPRLYSIASSLKAHPEQVHLTVDTLRYDAHGRKRHGVSSTFLADRVTDSTRLPVFIQTAKHFRLPEKPERPVIMVGPGTGIAPFRAFLQERQATAASGGNWLFFGAQKSATDYFYREELEALQAGGCLTRLDLAFSRRPSGKSLRPDADERKRGGAFQMAGGRRAFLRLRRRQAHGQGRGRHVARGHPRSGKPQRRRSEGIRRRHEKEQTLPARRVLKIRPTRP